MLTDVDHKLENDIEFETDHTISDVRVLIPDACSSLPVLVNRGFNFLSSDGLNPQQTHSRSSPTRPLMSCRTTEEADGVHWYYPG